jgi:uncharacterized integral membrane protein
MPTMMMMIIIIIIIIINVRAVNDFLFLGVGFHRAKILVLSLCVLTLDTLLILDFYHFEATDSSKKYLSYKKHVA